MSDMKPPCVCGHLQHRHRGKDGNGPCLKSYCLCLFYESIDKSPVETIPVRRVASVGTSVAALIVVYVFIFLILKG